MKHDYDKILTRILSILHKLNIGEILSPKELAEEYNVSTKTISRDFQRLESLGGYPIEKQGKNWKMAEGFQLEKVVDIEEKIILEMIQKFSDGIGKEFSKKVKNILAKIKNESFYPIYAKINLEDISDKLKEIQILEKAIQQKKIISFEYVDKHKKKIPIKKAQPLKIVNFEGLWYLIFLNTKNQIRKYYLKEISKIEIQQKTFTVNLEINNLLENAVSIWFTQENKPFEVKLFASEKIAIFFERKPISKNQTIKKVKNGVEITLFITSEMEILPIVKYWLPYVKIISPISLQNKLGAEMKEYIE